MENKKILAIIEGAATVVLGVLIAIFGTKTLGLYFGIMLIVAGAGFLAICVAGLIKTKELVFYPVVCFAISLAFGILMIVHPELVDFFVSLFVYLLIAVGGAMVLYGVYLICKRTFIYGAGTITIGAVISTLGILYLTVFAFRVAFWVIVGVVVALSGVFIIVAALLNKKIIDNKKTTEIKEVEVVKEAE